MFKCLDVAVLTTVSDSILVSVDDKHRCKVGEPGYPVAAAERGRRVLVGCDQSF